MNPLSLIHDPNAIALDRHCGLTGKGEIPLNGVKSEADSLTPFQKVMKALTTSKNAEIVVPQLEKYGALSQEERYQIAEYVTANFSATYVCNHIHLFGLTENKLLYDLAKFITKFAAGFLIIKIRNFNLTEEQRIEIALCLVKNKLHTHATILYIEFLLIKKKSAIYEIIQIACLQDAELKLFPRCHAILIKAGYSKKELEPFCQKAFEARQTSGKIIANPLSYQGLFIEMEKKAFCFLPKLRQQIEKEKNPKLKKVLDEWLYEQQVRLYLLFGDKELPSPLLAFFEKLVNHHCPEERRFISKMVLENFYLQPASLNLWLDSLPCKKETKEIHTHTLIPLAILSAFEKINSKVLKEFAQELVKERKNLRYGPYMSLLVKYLTRIQRLNLSKEQKFLLISLIFFPKENFVHRLRILLALYELDQIAFLLDAKVFPLPELLKIYQEAFEKVFDSSQFFPIYQGDTFRGRYETVIENGWRDPYAPFIYMGKIKALDDPDQALVQQGFNDFILAVLQGTLPQLRASSPHLKKLAEFSSGKEIVEKWNALGSSSYFLEKYLSGQQVEPHKGWTIGVTEDPCDLMLIGKETTSCVNIEGDPDANKALLAYLIDGKNKVIAIKGDDKTLKARVIIRLLFHQEQKCPMLFIESIYSEHHDSILQQAIILFAKELALNLKLILLQKKEGSENFPGTLESFGSGAPYEYSDALKECIEKGIFTIWGLSIVD